MLKLILKNTSLILAGICIGICIAVLFLHAPLLVLVCAWTAFAIREVLLA